MSRHKMFTRSQHEAAVRMEQVAADGTRRDYIEDIGPRRAMTLPSLAKAGFERQVEVLKSVQLPVWHAARNTYQPGFAQLASVGWVFGNHENWAGTADSYAPGKFLKPENVALLYIGFTGQMDFLKPSVPEILAVLVPLRYDREEGNLVGDVDKAIARSVTCAARGNGSAPPAPYSRQFNYATESPFMHSAYCAAVQYLAAIQGNFEYAARCLGEIGSGLQLPVPQMCQLVDRGVNDDGVRHASYPVPLSRLRDDELDPDGVMVLDVESIPEGISLHDGSVKIVQQTRTWRIVSGHVRAIYHRYGEGNGTSDFRPTVDVCVSTR